MNLPVVTRYGGIFVIFGLGLLFATIFSGYGDQRSFAGEPSDEVVGDDAYGVEQMTDLERRIKESQSNQLPKATVQKTVREIELEAKLAECENKLSIMMYSDSDKPK